MINPCDASSISLSILLEKDAVNISILDALVGLKMPITMDDLSVAITVLPEECSILFSHMLTLFKKLSEKKKPVAPPQPKEVTLSDLLHRSLLVMKPAFATNLISNGAKPLRETITLVVDDKSLTNQGLLTLLAQECTSENRATMLVQALVSNLGQTASEVLMSGPMNAQYVDLAEVMASELLATNVSFIGRSVTHIYLFSM